MELVIQRDKLDNSTREERRRAEEEVRRKEKVRQADL